MTKVIVEPGICGLTTYVTANYVDEDEDEVVITVESACPSINKITEVLGDTFQPYDVCLAKPRNNPFYEYASDHLPPHPACPVIAGIIKCIEAECNLALKKNASITFVE